MIMKDKAQQAFRFARYFVGTSNPSNDPLDYNRAGNQFRGFANRTNK